MRTIEDQLRAYTVQIDGDQRPVTIDEALALVDAVRVQDSGTRLPPTRSRKQGILIAASIAAAVLLLLGSTFFLRGRVDDTEVGTASTIVPTTAPTPVTTVAPEPTQSIETPLGTWVWQKIDPPITGLVIEFNGAFYAVDSDPFWSRYGEPVAPEDRDPENWLRTSSDGITWERSPLPDEMRGLALSIRSHDDSLIIRGMSEVDDTKLWASADGVTWTAQPALAGVLAGPVSPPSNPLDLPVPEISVEGVEIQIDAQDPVTLGGVQLVQGDVWFGFPEDVDTFLGGGGSLRPVGEGASDGRSGSLTFVDVETGTIRNSLSYVVDGSAIEYTFWSGPVQVGDVIRTARIDLGSVALVEQLLIESGPIYPRLSVLWRSGGRGEPFAIVDDPFASFTVLTPDSRSSTFDTLVVRDGRFVAYGSVPGGPTTRVNENVIRNEPSTVAAVATSPDGLTWAVTEIRELVNPFNVETLDDGRVVWNGWFGYWISDDGLTGEFTSLEEGSDPVEAAFGGLVMNTGNGFRISEDGIRWSPIPFPQRVGIGITDLGFSSDRAWYNVTPDGDETTSWVGYFEN
jgi:hypothetical protein